jgi:hypothetical protein
LAFDGLSSTAISFELGAVNVSAMKIFISVSID